MLGSMYVYSLSILGNMCEIFSGYLYSVITHITCNMYVAL